jgi:DHA2 family integral membrane protein (MFS transporter)
VNGTTREVGGALGVAVLGSVLTSSYASSLGSSAPEAVRHSLGAAVGTPFIDEASAAFVDAMGTSLLAGAAVALLGAAIVFKFLPARAPEAVVVPDDARALVGEETAELEPALA